MSLTLRELLSLWEAVWSKAASRGLSTWWSSHPSCLEAWWLWLSVTPGTLGRKVWVVSSQNQARVDLVCAVVPS